MKVFISAGETSGDMHAGEVVSELRHRFPSLQIHGVAGPRMLAAGCLPLHQISELNVMGLAEVLGALSRIRRIEESLLAWCIREQPDVAVLVDFSSFHMRLGRKLRQLGIPVVHFIAPKLWAWGAWRVRKLRRSQDALACILPFEPAWFSDRGIAARYVGNPSAGSCAHGWSLEQFRQHIGVAEGRSVLALLPGSRPQELKVHVPLLREVLLRLQATEENPPVCVVPVAPGVSMDVLEPLWQAGALPLDRNVADYALRADAAVAVSGTATLELALWDVPTVLIYQTSALTVFLARMLVRLKCVGLANIILDDRPVMPELIQHACTVENILGQLLPLLHQQAAADDQRHAFIELRRRLGQQRAAAGVADMVEELLHG
ncbi:lipid-A-disaccharide synthase [Mariprofundus erugo]|uniref:lipid-A-disaccharide synthase n=1 Tax=Mariprofundus erugo TaxID=2528639 RepID=UPI0010FE71E8|nr:lipid-A-disaccharide synthase [Mariprofundus erugo]TLS76527.1 lipid-A-disaccharide synthase [Mariprofundus erugo]